MGDYQGGGRGAGRGYGGSIKRRREEEHLDPMRLLLSTLMAFGDETQNFGVSEEAVVNIVKKIKQEARVNPKAMQSMLINCAVQLAPKVPLYSIIIGLINVDEPAFVTELLQQVSIELDEALKNPKMYRKARLLLRLLTALVVPGVLQASSVLPLLHSFITTAVTIAENAPAGSDGRTWQSYADYLVYMALVALPFGGSELAESALDAVKDLVQDATRYLTLRPRSTQPGLRPFSAAVKEDDELAESDTGGASFLPEVVAAVESMIRDEGWTLACIPCVHQMFEVTLAGALQSQTVAPPSIPEVVPVEFPTDASETLAGSLVLQAYPPRGIMRLVGSDHPMGDIPAIERLLAEDYVMDTIAFFEGDRVQCAKQLCGGLPLPYNNGYFLAEVIFSQMIRLPTPEFRPIMYGALIVDVCKLNGEMARALSRCMREMFARMNVMDPALRERIAEWLAYHLSNFDYFWPWNKWAHVLDAPPYDGQRRFCIALMNRMVRLSYWEKVNAAVAEDVRKLMPPKPSMPGLPPTEGSDADTPATEEAWAGHVLKLIRSKTSAEDLETWLNQKQVENVLGSKVSLLRMLMRAVLVAGAKSYTHMNIALERYYGPLVLLANDTGFDGQAAVVAVAADVWKDVPQRAVMAVDRLMTLRLVSADAIISWVFGDEGLRCISDQSRCGMAWEMLQRAVNKTISRVQDAGEDLFAARLALNRARDVHQRLTASEINTDALAQIEGALPEKEAYVAETTCQRDAAVLQVVRSFVKALELGGFATAQTESLDTGMLDADSTEQKVLRDYLMACLRSFLREYNVPSAEVGHVIDNEILPQVNEELEELIHTQIRL